MSFSGAGLKLRFSLARRRDSSGKLHTNRYICVAGVEQVLLQFIVPTVREWTDSVPRSSTGPGKGLSHWVILTVGFLCGGAGKRRSTERGAGGGRPRPWRGWRTSGRPLTGGVASQPSRLPRGVQAHCCAPAEAARLFPSRGSWILNDVSPGCRGDASWASRLHCDSLRYLRHRRLLPDFGSVTILKLVQWGTEPSYYLVVG